MKRKNILLGLLLTLFVSNTLFSQSYPINVTTFVKPPYPTGFEDWDNVLNKVFVNISNISSKEIDVNLNISITGPNGFTVYKQKALDSELNLGSHLSVNIKGNDWETYDVNLKFEDIFPEDERKFILKNRAFREGNYQVCIQAVDKSGKIPLSSKNEGCFSFEVIYGDPPNIINPTVNAVIPSHTPSMVAFNWTHQVIGAPFDYSLKIIELPSLKISDIYQEMNNPGKPPFYEEDNIRGFSKVLLNENFKNGYQYAVRVTAQDPNDKVFFKNAGHSKIIVFKYNTIENDCSNMGSFILKPHYPMEGDTLPFFNLPIISEMTPQCDQYRQLYYVFSINKKKLKKVRVKWKKGALEYMQTNLKDKSIRWGMGSKMQMIQKTFKRGRKYSWGAESTVKTNKGGTYGFNIDSVGFVVGMPKPILESPAANEKVGAGNISFTWKPIMRQKKILPDYKVMNLSAMDKKKKHPESIISKVNEHWVIQVFSTNKIDYQKRIASKDGKIDIDPDDYYDKTSHSYNGNSILNELGKEITADINITKKGDYWWRVVWMINPDLAASSVSESNIYHASSLKKFHVGAKNNDDSSPEGDCISNSIAEEIKDKKETKDLKKNQVLKIGLFNLKVTEITSSKNNVFSGKGEIVIKFLNKLKMEVEFKNIKKNKANQIFAGEVKAVKNTKNSQFFTKYNKYIQFAKKGAVLGLNKTKKLFKKTSLELANELEVLAKSSDRLVRSLMGKTTGLPVGLDKTFDGNTFVISIAEMTFTPRNAVMNGLINVKIPGLDFDLDKYMVLSTEDISFSPSGLGTEGKALLAFDLNFVLSKDNNADADEIIIKSRDSNANNLENSTYVQWDCHGFKQLNMAFEYKFSRKTIIPDDENDKGRVIAKAAIKVKNGMNIMGKVTMESFQLPFEKLKGYAFEVKDAYIDLSNKSNPDGLLANLPKNYKSSTLGNKDVRLGNMWRGFWLKKMEVKLPMYIGNVDKNNRNTKISIDNMIIDKSGFTASFLVRDLIKWEEKITKDTKSVDGCALSIDSLYADVLQNNLVRAGISGKIGLAITDKRDYLKYRGVIDSKKGKSKNETAFDFSLYPQKNISIPILAFAKLDIKQSSTFKMSIGKKSYIDVNINAAANINTDSLSDDAKKGIEILANVGLKMKGIKIQNLRYNSTKGIVSKDFKFSLASPQKFMAGFPLSLKNFKLSEGNNPKVTFDVGLNLMSKTKKNANSIAVVTKLSILTQLELNNLSLAKIKNFKIVKVKLDSIDIKAQVSSIKFQGMLVFYDETKKDSNKKDYNRKGFKGRMKLSLPSNINVELDGEFGTIFYKKTKQFNTDKWYSYWRIYGKVGLGKGVPIFSGVSLYKLGGGVYYHMTSTFKKGKYEYAEDFRTSLGLQFEGTIGSTDQGKAFVCDTKISAEFTKDWGMKKFMFIGKLHMMNKSMNDKASKIIGDLDLEYVDKGISPIESRKGKDESFVHAKLSITANLGAVKGGMDSKGKMVMATFYSRVDKKKEKKEKKKEEKKNSSPNEEGYWFFNMGTPSKRGVLKVDFAAIKDKKKDKKKGDSKKGDKKEDKKKKEKKKEKKKKTKKPLIDVAFSCYIMAGHDVPGTLPPPSKAFLEILKKAKKGSSSGKTKDLSGGKVDELTSGKKREPYKGLGVGFAFGAAANLHFNAEPVPFYINVDAAIGFDINYTRDENRTCLESGLHPGDNFWYATGQLYAGLAADFGLHVKLFFIDKQVSIFKGAATVLLKGGFPNPNWAYGEGDLHYNVLNGLVEGQYHFQFDVGNKCTVVSSSFGQLAQMDFIQSIKPGDKDKKVDAFSECTAAFALPVNKTMKIPVEEGKIKIIVPYIYKWTLEDNDGKTVPTEDIFFDSKHVLATLSPKVMLSGKSKFKQEIEIRAKEKLTNGMWIAIKDKNGTAWNEKRNYTFETDKAPNVIVDKNVLYTYPFEYQRSFLKGETDNNTGYIVQKKGVPGLFNNENIFVARFTRVDGSDYSFETEISFEDYHRIVNFDISKLENDKFYSMQIIEKQPIKFVLLGEESNNSDLNNLTVDDGNKPLIPVKETSVSLLKGSKSTMVSKEIKHRELPGTSKKTGERIIYQFYFKTSKYNTFKQKIAGKNWNKKSKTFFTKNAIYDLNANLDEALDQFDVKGYIKNEYKVDPLVTVYLNDDIFEHTYYDKKYPVNDYIKDRVNLHVRFPVKKITDYLKYKRIYGFGMMRDLKMRNFIHILSEETQYSNPIDKTELSLNNNPKPKNDGFVGNINGNNNGTSGGILGGVLSGGSDTNVTMGGFVPNNTLSIRYAAKLFGMVYLKEGQNFISKVMSKHIAFTTETKVNNYYTKYHIKRNHWWLSYYKNIRRTNLSPYLIDYDAWATTYNKYMISEKMELSMITIGKFIKDKSRFKSYVPHFLGLDQNEMQNTKESSFIIQYQYPVKKSYKMYKTGKKVKSNLKKGTNIRVKFKSNP